MDLKFFNKDQYKTVDMLFSALIPTDFVRNIPGAKEAGAANYLDYLLGTGGYYEIKDWKVNYPNWISTLDAYSKQKFGKPIHDLDLTDITSILELLESGNCDIELTKDNQKKMFSTLWRHCIQGCFSDPKWGGNKDKIMWKWYGYLEEPKQVKL